MSGRLKVKYLDSIQILEFQIKTSRSLATGIQFLQISIQFVGNWFYIGSREFYMILWSLIEVMGSGVNVYQFYLKLSTCRGLTPDFKISNEK